MSKDKAKTLRITLEPENNEQLMNLCGQLDENLNLLTEQFQVAITNRGHQFTLTGKDASVVSALIQKLYADAKQEPLTPKMVFLACTESKAGDAPAEAPSQGHSPASRIQGRTPNQRQYIQQIESNTIIFGVGPAGTGKTYLAVALAVLALESEQVKRILLVRPAVEAGERLGFLPGDLSEKVDPYLRPLYDALYDMMGAAKVERLLEEQVIEVAPLAYMRGRTLNESMIILDEAQNTTREQMKMFLTRLGFGSKAIITGDLTQVDLPKATPSGLTHATDILGNIKDIAFTHFEATDVVRHPLIQKIIHAYEQNRD